MTSPAELVYFPLRVWGSNFAQGCSSTTGWREVSHFSTVHLQKRAGEPQALLFWGCLLFKSKIAERRIRAAFGKEWAHWADLFPLLQPLDEIITWLELPPVDHEETLNLCLMLREFFTEEQLTVGTTPVGTRGEAKISFARLSVAEELAMDPGIYRWRIQEQTDQRSRRDLIAEYLRKARAGVIHRRPEFSAQGGVVPGAVARSRPLERKAEPAPAPLIPAERPKHWRSTTRQQDCRAWRDFLRRIGFPRLPTAIFLGMRKRARFERARGYHSIRTFQKWEAKEHHVSVRTIKRCYVTLFQLGAMWWINPGSPVDMTAVLGIAKNPRDWRRRMMEKRKHRKVVKSARRFARPEQSGRRAPGVK